MFLHLSLTVSADKPPISILSINSAVLPSIAGDVTLDVVNAWVRLSTNALWDPDSGLFTEVVLLLSLESSTLLRVAAISSALSLVWSSIAGVSSVSSSPEQRRMSSFKFWMASVWSSEFLASCASIAWRPCRTVAMLTSVVPQSFSRWISLLDKSTVLDFSDRAMSDIFRDVLGLWRRRNLQKNLPIFSPERKRGWTDIARKKALMLRMRQTISWDPWGSGDEIESLVRSGVLRYSNSIPALAKRSSTSVFSVESAKPAPKSLRWFQMSLPHSLIEYIEYSLYSQHFLHIVLQQAKHTHTMPFRHDLFGRVIRVENKLRIAGLDKWTEAIWIPTWANCTIKKFSDTKFNSQVNHSWKDTVQISK